MTTQGEGWIIYGLIDAAHHGLFGCPVFSGYCGGWTDRKLRWGAVGADWNDHSCASRVLSASMAEVSAATPSASDRYCQSPGTRRYSFRWQDAVSSSVLSSFLGTRLLSSLACPTDGDMSSNSLKLWCGNTDP